VIPVGQVGQTDTWTNAQWRVDGRSTEGVRVPDRERDGCPTEGGSRGWPDGGVYKSGWPTFLGTPLQRPVSPARNAGAQGANE
jgi:hypothetical protein